MIRACETMHAQYCFALIPNAVFLRLAGRAFRFSGRLSGVASLRLFERAATDDSPGIPTAFRRTQGENRGRRTRSFGTPC